MIELIVAKSVHYVVAFGGALALTLLLTPIVREMNRRMGMVDNPDPRRINKVPIPRGGGLALFAGVLISYSAFVLVTGRPPLQGDNLPDSTYWKLSLVSVFVVALGYADDKWSLPPKAKLAGQVFAALLCWWWTGLGFSRLWPSIPAWADCLLTVFWITGAINAFNLIDGLDGLASGIAFIATLGMAGTLFIVENPQAALFHFAFAGGLLGFLRYNYNPASVFLGDSGSMYIGFTLAVLPLASQVPNSFLVSAGVPILAMGVPIFDTALAIVRRSIRHLIHRRETRGRDDGSVMTADADHLHHRLLRAMGLNQRKAAWSLYGATAAAVALGLVAMSMRSRTAGLWLIAVAGASVVVFKNVARIELYDAGKLLHSVARDRTIASRRRVAKLTVPIYLACDIALLIGIFFLVLKLENIHGRAVEIRLSLLVHVFATFAFLTLARVYKTVWSRAMMSNFIRLAIACAFGAVVGGAAVSFAPNVNLGGKTGFMFSYALLSFVALAGLRISRPAVRDLFYALDCGRLRGRKDVSRILVYGAGLRYRAFRRELVRNTSANERIIVGIIDDDFLLRGQYIGGIRIEGTLSEAPEIINRLNVDSVVIAFVISDERLKVVRKMLAPTGVKVTRFSFSEVSV